MSHSHNSSWQKLLYICCIVCFLFFVCAYMRMPVFPLWATSLGVDTAGVGFLNAIFMFFAGILCIPVGFISDSIGRRIPVIAGVALLSCASLATCFSSSFAQLAAACVLSGISTAVFAPPLMSYVADIIPQNKLGSAFGIYSTCLYTGMAIGPAIGGLVGKQFGLPNVFLCSAVSMLFVLPVVIMLLPAVPSARQSAVQPGTVWRSVVGLLRNPSLIVCLYAMLSSCIGYGMFITFLPLYAGGLGFDASQIGLVFTSQACGNILLRIPLGKIGDRIGNRGVLVMLGLAGLAASLVILGSSRELHALVAGAFMFGAAVSIAFTALVALTAESATPEEKGLAMGCYNSCIYLGMMLSSALMGTLIKMKGFGFAFYVAAMVVVLSALFFALVFFRQKNKFHLIRLRAEQYER